MIEEDGIYQFLTSDSAVNGLVQGRVYAVAIPPKASNMLPVVVHFVVNGESIESLDGDNSTETIVMQFSCYAATRKQSRILARAVRSLVIPKSDGSGTTKTVSYTLPDGTTVQSARLHSGIRDLPIEAGENGYVFHAAFDAELTYS